MAFGHEKLDVYRLAIDYVAWVYSQANELGGIHRHARDQWLRASQSIALNIAEGNAKAAQADRRRYFEIARGSAVECAAIQDVLRVSDVLDENEHEIQKNHLYHFRYKMIKWCSSFWKQRKARLPDSIWIHSVRRNAASFQKERILLGQMALGRERRSLRLPGPRTQPSAAALLTPKNPFCHCIILNLKWY